MSIFKKKNNTYSIDITKANETLQNVFAVCDHIPNTIPFDKLVLRQKAKTRCFTIGKYISGLFIVLLFLVPFVFPHSPITLTKNSNSTGTDVSITNHYISEGKFVLTLSGDDIDYSRCYASSLNSDGTYEDYPIISCDPDEHTIVFTYPKKTLNIYIYTEDGECLQLLLTPKQ